MVIAPGATAAMVAVVEPAEAELATVHEATPVRTAEQATHPIF